jgi:hypothetical protein
MVYAIVRDDNKTYIVLNWLFINYFKEKSNISTLNLIKIYVW